MSFFSAASPSVITGLAFVLLSATSAAQAAEPDDLRAGRIKAHIEFLADDSLNGRQPGTPGYDIAANYVASQFRQIGLQPAGTDDSYLQPVPLRRSWMDIDSVSLSVERDGGVTPFKFPSEFAMSAGKAHELVSLNAEMVFAGYGIDAPSLDYSDFPGLDVSGKIVVFLAGQPRHFPSEEGAHFSSGREKMRAALERGAVGIVEVYTPLSQKRYSWDRVERSIGAPSMGWLTAEGTILDSPAALKGFVRIHHNVAGALFEGARHSLNDMLERDNAGEPLAAFELTGRLDMQQRNRHEVITSANVAGILPGADPLLAAEYLVYTAHLDHLGISHSGHEDDKINNGALDNASGISVMIETAREFAQGERPRRSIIFVAVTAEEKGLVGSEYFAMHPTVPKEKMVAVINLDMPLLLYDFGDVIAFGASHSSLGAVVEVAANEQGVALTPDPFPGQNLFVRSDHYRFVQQGIPSIFLVTGQTARDGTDTMPIFQRFLTKHYHQPSDDLNLPINYEAASRFTLINKRIGELVSNDAQRPYWNEGDFFGETFAR